MRRKMITVAACAALLTGFSGGVAFAGEVNGNGTELPLKGASICKYSGLNDEINADEPTRTQSYGTFLQFFGKAVAGAMDMPPGAGIQFLKAGEIPSPGMACNPTSGFEE
jgi:hypothetical protein